MQENNVLTHRDGNILTVTLNRPAALNAFDSAMLGALVDTLGQAAGDHSVRAVVLTGSGRAFCAGQDLSDPAVAPRADGTMPDLGAVIERHYTPLVRCLRSFPVPVVAAVNGVAAGAGASVALACDVVIAAREASFIQAFGRVGLVPDSGATWLLPRLVGRARALGMVLLGEKLPAPEAERIGLIWGCVDAAELAGAAQALAARLAAMPVKALAATRQAIDDAQAMTLDQALVEEGRLQSRFGASADYREGLAAFGAKRKPVFTDR